MKKLFTIIFLGGFLFLPMTAFAKSCCVCKMYSAGESVSTASRAFNTITDDTDAKCTTGKKDELNAGVTLSYYTCSIAENAGCEVEEATPEMTTIAEELGLKDVVLGINIPSLHFSAPPTKVDSEGNLYISWAAEYIKAIYNFALVAISILAVVVLIISGAQIITSAGGPAKGAAYKRITQAIIGLFIAWGSYVVLYTINPDLIALKSLKIAYVQKIEIEVVSDADYKTLTGKSPGAPAELLKMAVEAGKKIGLTDDCMMKTIVSKESGGNAGAIGHDENFNRTTHIVWARRNFLLSGTTYKGSSFTPVATDKSNYKATMNASGIKNDDSFNVNNPPDYGLDWRFSHGIGLGQMTINPNKSMGGYNSCETTRADGKTERGISKGGECIGISKLMEPETAVEQSAKLFKSNLECAAGLGLSGEEQFRGALFAYAAGCGALKKLGGSLHSTLQTHKTVTRAMTYYTACKADSSIGPDSAPEQSPVATSDDEESN
ncbi:MAG: pilin [Patescibacteria group bacterium]